MIKNKAKFIKKLFQLLIEKLRHLKHRLDFELCTNKFIYNKLINAYQNVSAYQFVYFKSFDLLVNLINNLCSLIITY